MGAHVIPRRQLHALALGRGSSRRRPLLLLLLAPSRAAPLASLPTGGRSIHLLGMHLPMRGVVQISPPSWLLLLLLLGWLPPRPVRWLSPATPAPLLSLAPPLLPLRHRKQPMHRLPWRQHIGARLQLDGRPQQALPRPQAPLALGPRAVLCPHVPTHAMRRHHHNLFHQRLVLRVWGGWGCGGRVGGVTRRGGV